jgi:glycosyltransferase involved in cell wall biosynthesis
MHKKIKIVYCTPSIYIAGGIERVLTTKVNYLANQEDKYEISIILTDGYGKEPFFPLSEKVHIINLNIGFEELWGMSLVKKVFAYLTKKRRFKRMLRQELMRIKADIFVSTLRREINFICDIPDGSRKIGELHVNRLNYRNFASNESNFIKNIFAKWWMHRLVRQLKRLDKLVVLTEQDKLAWKELNNVCAIPNPLPSIPEDVSLLTEKRVIAVGRYSYEKGFDRLLQVWSIVEKECPDWKLAVFGSGDRTSYIKQMQDLKIDENRCELHSAVENIGAEYLNSSVFALSSRFEGFGMVLLEAMSHGLPVVSFDCPWGPRAIIDNGKDGILVENGNVQQLADGVIRLIRDKEQRESLARSAREKARQYDISIIGQQWEQLFVSVL